MADGYDGGRHSKFCCVCVGVAVGVGDGDGVAVGRPAGGDSTTHFLRPSTPIDETKPSSH